MKYLHAHRRNGHGPSTKQVATGAVLAYGTIAVFNRWTHKPHEHKREIARNLRRLAA